MSDASTSNRWLAIIGIGEDGWDGLGAEARGLIAAADLLYGGIRHLAHLPDAIAQRSRVAWPSPMAAAVRDILEHHRNQKKIAVLGSGDPMLYGVGVSLTRDLEPKEFRVIPQVSAFALACARLGWPAAETTLISLVARPIEQVMRFLVPDQRLILYSEDGTTPAKVAQLLTRAGYGGSHMHVFENLGGPAEQHHTGTPATWTQPCGNLNLIALVCVVDQSTLPLALTPGLPESAFETDGQLTKREVRAATLARLAPLPGQLLWDVGAGTGTVGIEWMRTHPSCACTAFEEKPHRAALILRNAKKLGVPGLNVLEGCAPHTFLEAPSPHAIFIGGGIGTRGLLEACWDRLRPQGKLIANAVTIESEGLLAAWQKLYGGELIRIQVARAEKIGTVYAWRQMMPITQLAVTKP